MIVTLATMNMFHGALLEFVGTKAINCGSSSRNAFTSFGLTDILHLTRADGQRLWAFRVLLWWWWGVVAGHVGHPALHRVWARVIYAMGGNMEAVKQVGFQHRRTQFFIYCYVGLLASIMGHHPRVPDPVQQRHLHHRQRLHAIAAVVLGGASILEDGDAHRYAPGLVMISILEKNLVLLGLSSYWQQFFVGALIIVLGVALTYGDVRSILRRRRVMES